MPYRSISYIAWKALGSNEIQLDKPPGLAPGDRLIALQAADAEAGHTMQPPPELSGWTPITRVDDEDTFTDGSEIFDYGLRSRAWAATIGSTVPSSFTFTQGDISDVDGIAALIAISGAGSGTIYYATAKGSGDTITAPSVSLPSGTGTQILFGAGTSVFGASPDWSVPTGFNQRTPGDLQSDSFTNGVVATRTVSAGATGTAVLDSDWSQDFLQAIVIVVPHTGSGGSGGQTPDLPVFPPFTPARGSSDWRYTVHGLMSGDYLGDLRPSQIGAMDRRINEPGTVSFTVPVPNKRIAKRLQQLIPRERAAANLGPAALAMIVWRAGNFWDLYWLTTARISQQRRQKPMIEITGMTLDGYMRYVRLREDLSYTDTDLVDILAGLLNSMQSDDNANIGLELTPDDDCGTTQTRSYLATDNRMYGDLAAELVNVDDGIEIMADPSIDDDGVLHRYIRWATKLGDTTKTHLFTQSPTGGDILDWGVEIRPGATYMTARGDAPESDDTSVPSTPLESTVHKATAWLTGGYPRLDATIDRPGVTTIGTLEDYATAWLARSAGTIWVRSVTVAIGAHPTISPASLGDKVRQMMTNEWFYRTGQGAGLDVTARLIGLGTKPGTRGSGKDELTLILEGSNAES